MRYRSLGESGLLVSVLGLGCNNFGGRLHTPDPVTPVAETIAALHELVAEGEQVKGNAAAADWIPSQGALADIDRIVPPVLDR